MTPEQLKASKPYVYDKVQKHGMRIVRLEYDYICNFRCQHCDIKPYQVKDNRRKLSIIDVENIARQADEMGFSQFVISGGEPLVYPDLMKVIEAIDPQRFYITTDTNGWLLDDEFAQSLKAMGVDKVQVSIDSVRARTHDVIRNKDGSWWKALRAVICSQNAGLNVIVQTVVDKKRARGVELEQFINSFNSIGAPVCILYAKPVGAWAGRDDLMLDQSDIDYVEGLCKKYNAFSHLTPTGECIACKRMINITKWGDVNPCPVMQEYSMGNIFKEPLADIMQHMEKKFSGHIPVCIVAQEEDWKGYVNELNNS